MAENGDDPPDNVVPFPVGHAITAAIAGQLVEYYRDLVAEPLPQKHLALLQRFDALTREGPALPERSEVPAEKAKSAE
jgi:hypothetical protein